MCIILYLAQGVTEHRSDWTAGRKTDSFQKRNNLNPQSIDGYTALTLLFVFFSPCLLAAIHVIKERGVEDPSRGSTTPSGSGAVQR